MPNKFAKIHFLLHRIFHRVFHVLKRFTWFSHVLHTLFTGLLPVVNVSFSLLSSAKTMFQTIHKLLLYQKFKKIHIQEKQTQAKWVLNCNDIVQQRRGHPALATASTTSCSFFNLFEFRNYRAFTKLFLCLFKSQRSLHGVRSGYLGFTYKDSRKLVNATN